MTVFWCCFLCGQAAAVVCDILRAYRRCVRVRAVSVAVQDVFLCAFVFKLFSFVINVTNDGALRWYEFASAAGSMILYYSCESVYVMRVFVSAVTVVLKIFNKIKAFFASAAAVLKRFARFIFSKIRIPFDALYGSVRQFYMKKTSKSG